MICSHLFKDHIAHKLVLFQGLVRRHLVCMYAEAAQSSKPCCTVGVVLLDMWILYMKWMLCHVQRKNLPKLSET